MVEETGNVALEQATGGSLGPNAHTEGQTYEAIVDSLKRGESGAETGEAAAEETATTDPEAPAKSEAPPAEDELRLMTDEEIAALPPELQTEAKALRKRFQAAYTKKTQAIAETRKQAEMYQRFETDPAFRAEVYRQLHQQYGQPVQPAATQPTAQTVPPEYVEMRQRTLPAEMQWMAESLAMGDYQRDQAFQQKYLTPLQQEQQRTLRERAQAEYQAAQGEVLERFPAWQTHEDDMVELVDFMKSPALKHARFGNKLELLYRLVAPGSSQAAQVQAALRQTAAAAQAKSVTSGASGRSTAVNLEDRIRGASNDEEAWTLIRKTHGGR